MMLKKTALNAAHHALNARMVDFGGWEMPVNYGSQIDEHHAVRCDAGMFDVSHMAVVDAQGAGTRDFLRYALANNVDKLQDGGRALYSCMLRENGGVIDDLIVYFINETFFRLIINAATAEKDIAWLEQLRNSHSPHLSLTRRADLSMLAVQGPHAATKLWRAFPSIEKASSLISFSSIFDGDCFVARTGYTGEDGFEVIAPHQTIVDLWQKLLQAQVKPCGLGARDTLRLEAGMALYGQEMDETITPLEAGLAWTVDLKSARDFVGKAVLLTFKPTYRLVGLSLLDSGGVLRAHQIVRSGASYDGEITSGTFSPTLNRSIALARVPVAVADNDIVHVVIRNKTLAARVVKPPFVRHGKIIIDL
ncbi:MAG: glycine cleavage system aminomethyltransferase GcvT [Burkholderiales bacterium]|nr:glycine cleavage system aminomethyltransferase GcvT [Burkholderiales bacterium]